MTGGKWCLLPSLLMLITNINMSLVHWEKLITFVKPTGKYPQQQIINLFFCARFFFPAFYLFVSKHSISTMITVIITESMSMESAVCVL